jgi:hypothetical protein
MAPSLERPCANPGCHCQTGDVTCSLWCGALDRPAGVRCLCRHDNCVRPLARAPLWATPLVTREPIPGRRPPGLPRLYSA